MNGGKPAILGGSPAFARLVPIVKPPLYRYTGPEFLSNVKAIVDSGMVTSGARVAELESKLAEYLQVRAAVGLSSCTSGLILVLQLLGLRNKEILIPSFTFVVTAHAAYWNNCKIKFVDCDPNTFDISVEDVKKKISEKTAAIMGTHIFGNPCPGDTLQKIANEYGAKLIFDSAHGLGGNYKGKKNGGYGDAEIFSCSPTKLFVTMEGGIVSTNNVTLADALKVARNYGNHPDYTCETPGLNARMTEVNALVGLEILKEIDEMVKNRNKYAELYRANLTKIPGLKFQTITPGAVHTYKDFAIIVDPKKFGIDRDKLYDALSKENIMTRKYFSPAVHQLKAYSRIKHDGLPNTEFLTRSVLCLPIYSFMDESLIKDICLTIQRVHDAAEEINSKFK